MKHKLDGDREETRLRRLLFSLPAFRHAVHGPTRSSMIVGQLAAVAMTGVALALRFYLDALLPPGFPYLTFFPIVVITGFVWGIYPGITAGVLSGLCSWFWFIQPSGSFALDGPAATALAFYVFVVTTDIGLLFLALRALGAQVRSHQALAAALQMQHLVSKEVDHRLKNLMATINGLISMLQKHATTPKELADQCRQEGSTPCSNSIGFLRSRGLSEREPISLWREGLCLFGTGASPRGLARTTAKL